MSIKNISELGLHVVSLKRVMQNHRLNELIEILNEIQGVDTGDNFFELEGEFTFRRAELSFVVFKGNEPVCLLLSYFKFADDSSPMDSVYIHRFVTKKNYRRLGIGEWLIKYALNYYFSNIKWLNHVTLQVTEEPRNSAAINLYEKVGFTYFGEKYYKHKRDSILVIERGAASPTVEQADLFPNPRLNNFQFEDVLFYFSTSSKEKKIQFQWLFSLFNLKLDFYDVPSELVEPQVESDSKDALRLLVSYPLKNAARFIKKKPFIVEDTMLFVEQFNRDFETAPELPGLDTKRWWKQLGNEGLLELMRGSAKRKAKYVSQIGCYLGAKQYVYGEAELKGSIALEPQTSIATQKQFPRTNPYFFHQIFIPDGYEKPLSMLNQQEFTSLDYRRKALESLLQGIPRVFSIDESQILLNFDDEYRNE